MHISPADDREEVDIETANDPVFTAEQIGWRFALGTLILVGAYAAWPLIPVVMMTDLEPGAKAGLSGLLGATPFMSKFVALAIMGSNAGQAVVKTNHGVPPNTGFARAIASHGGGCETRRSSSTRKLPDRKQKNKNPDAGFLPMSAGASQPGGDEGALQAGPVWRGKLFRHGKVRSFRVPRSRNRHTDCDVWRAPAKARPAWSRVSDSRRISV